MSRFRAVFFDRDGTLTRMSPARLDALSCAFAQAIRSDAPTITWSVCLAAFQRIHGSPPFVHVRTLEQEHEFWRAVYEAVLRDAGVRRAPAVAARALYAEHPFYRLMEPYEDTVPVLEELRRREYRLGVISDTFPSLELTLREMSLGGYFESFTASALVGAGKPDPAIFRAAADSLGVSPQEAVFVDDTLREADGAGKFGFTAFHLDRTLAEPDFAHWKLGNLCHLVHYLDVYG
jgi:HAD superfamily hydrolase (TIGR01509 family)